ncbi:GNAT family N-acetyltransferase [Salmonella enterica]|nr:GNAT family N-acetyltransferase [Salmonella enterica]EDR1539100.1 GNAT family N-acetyltransferase [Salmonella enterica subsp. enterica serovar Javiana]EGO3302112.1 GNAT family N-acetyltransferase [Salmonella enterica]EHC5972877.1 GNAT family N-acetyltransferase [Salmonella enterica]EIU9581690.1 GNAT family N-acetyltransferase [Salmonella enterica]
MGAVRRPELFVSTHTIADFYCSEPSLNEWFIQRARRNQITGASRTFVICEEDSERVVGYYCLATGAIERSIAPNSLQRNMPERLPVMVLGRLAVDLAFSGKGLGGDLLQDAIIRCEAIAYSAGVVAVVVHALSDEAVAFYKHFGFQVSPVEPYTLLLPLPKHSF